MISAIVAVDNNWGIGFDGDLLEAIPADLKRFKELTTGHVVVMGSKTWNSLPKKPLPNRGNIVISRAKPLIMCNNTIRIGLEDTIDYLKYIKDDVFIIGGGTIYKELLPFCDRIYVTKIYKDHENVDTYFPNLDESYEWAPAFCSAMQTHNDLTYQFWEYDRIS